MLQGLEGGPLSRAYPERVRGTIQQTEALVTILKDRDIVVHRPRPLTDAEIASSPVSRPCPMTCRQHCSRS
jgi:hypothetical protein